MKRRVITLILIFSIILVMIPFVVWLIGNDRYSFTIDKMNNPSNIKPIFHLKPSLFCDQLKLKSAEIIVYCSGFISTEVPGQYNVEVEENKHESKLYISNERTLKYTSNNVNILSELLLELFPQFPPKVLHSREISDWCFTLSSENSIYQTNILKIINKLQSYFPLHYRFTSITEKQHSTELNYADMNCLYRFNLLLSSNITHLHFENYKATGPLNYVEKSVVGYFRHILEIPTIKNPLIVTDYSHSNGFLSLELDNVMRQLTVEQLYTTISLIHSFEEITKEEIFVPLPKSLADKATSIPPQLNQILLSQDLFSAFSKSQDLMAEAHTVAYSEDFFAILFFPIEHKIACLLPLFGPVLLLLIKSLFQTYKK
ncbi:hypothetical protein EDI_219220 [Entamoeba dispar SAW760]|uniref:GPI transamidase component PIG-S n=1 Tax=Entamoeba dispar (strain ATCC PRA-260 / SAW760) TaxID=370354 RepID=B0EQ80_ENTDS|nr:uncharacterized protein EDI_219220 [Entamoeba dispar SAW760]EDR23303.1 hypothetical protein EDI_219220 [Entamoeba dispar SAW760]|eukprot:EDR23303.1 hypothetical protein EDI_219220 [Entamoeba dispar SAW760]